MSSLTIKTQGVAAVDEGQVFIFRVKGVSDNVKDIDFTVTVIGDGSVTVSDLEIGEYTVTEITDWSFRYSVVNVEKSISLAVDESRNVITYGHIKTFNKWLDGNHSITNIFN